MCCQPVGVGQVEGLGDGEGRRLGLERGQYQLTNFQPNLTYSSILKYLTYYLSLLAEEGVTLHGVVGVGRDEVEHVVVRGVRRAVGDPGGLC